MQALEVGDKSLMNFRVSDKVKRSFDTLCKYNGSNMTNELIRLMRSYIDQEGIKIIQEQHNADEIKKLTSRHIKAAQKSKMDNDWYDDSKKSSKQSQRHGEWIKGDDMTWRQGG
mgnify:FL=1